MEKSILVATQRYGYLAEAILKANPTLFEETPCLHREDFKDGEHYMRWVQSIKGRQIVIVGGTVDDTEFMEVCDIICDSQRYRAQNIELLIPFFGYQTMERPVWYGEDVKAKNRAHMLSYLPRTPGGLHVVMFDLHADGIPNYFENGVTTDHLYSKTLVKGVIANLATDGKLALGGTDAGRAAWVFSLASELQNNMGLVLKIHTGHDQTKDIAFAGDVRGYNVFMFDDLLRTGGTVKNAAHVYRSHGAKKIWMMCSHTVTSYDSMIDLLLTKDDKGSPLINHLYVTDSHPQALVLAAKFPTYVTVVSSEPVFSQYLRTGYGLPLKN